MARAHSLGLLSASSPGGVGSADWSVAMAGGGGGEGTAASAPPFPDSSFPPQSR